MPLLSDILEEFGKYLILVDKEDLGKFRFQGHNSRFHHWQWGMMLLYLGKLVETLSAVTKLVFGDNPEEEE